MKLSIHQLALSVALVFATMTSVAYADDDDAQEMEAISKQFGFISIDEAKTKALAAKPGVIKDADLENRKLSKGWDYEFEIVDSDGKEWEVNIDAKTGEVSGIHRDWF